MKLIKGKARECVKALDGVEADRSFGRVVIGLCGVTVMDLKGAGAAPGAPPLVPTVWVWDPREESALVLAPDHPLALKL